ncbi:MAG: bifunctional ornithine acetyltransferase/N-acetylglutamate synthase, partial [Gemmatimonadota bacterium]
MAVIAADEPWSVAGVFTTNRCAAAPVVLCRDAIRRTPAVRSIVINSGIANALTGSRGAEDAASMKL